MFLFRFNVDGPGFIVYIFYVCYGLLHSLSFFDLFWSLLYFDFCVDCSHSVFFFMCGIYILMFSDVLLFDTVVVFVFLFLFIVALYVYFLFVDFLFPDCFFIPILFVCPGFCFILSIFFCLFFLSRVLFVFVFCVWFFLFLNVGGFCFFVLSFWFFYGCLSLFLCLIFCFFYMWLFCLWGIVLLFSCLFHWSNCWVSRKICFLALACLLDCLFADFC